jgi:hypothetical protein
VGQGAAVDIERLAGHHVGGVGEQVDRGRADLVGAAEAAGGVTSLGLKKSMFKTAVQLVAYPIGLIASAVIGWRHTKGYA